jgi:hypothetical protein
MKLYISIRLAKAYQTPIGANADSLIMSFGSSQVIQQEGDSDTIDPDPTHHNPISRMLTEWPNAVIANMYLLPKAIGVYYLRIPGIPDVVPILRPTPISFDSALVTLGRSVFTPSLGFPALRAFNPCDYPLPKVFRSASNDPDLNLVNACPLSVDLATGENKVIPSNMDAKQTLGAVKSFKTAVSARSVHGNYENVYQYSFDPPEATLRPTFLSIWPSVSRKYLLADSKTWAEVTAITNTLLNSAMTVDMIINVQLNPNDVAIDAYSDLWLCLPLYLGGTTSYNQAGDKVSTTPYLGRLAGPVATPIPLAVYVPLKTIQNFDLGALIAPFSDISYAIGPASPDNPAGMFNARAIVSTKPIQEGVLDFIQI